MKNIIAINIKKKNTKPLIISVIKVKDELSEIKKNILSLNTDFSYTSSVKFLSVSSTIYKHKI